MDRELDIGIRRRRRARRWGWAGASVALLAALFVFLPGWLRPSIDRDRIRTARVERGPVEGVVQASGVVIPAYELALSSPVEARVEKILKRPGEAVAAGEEVLALDTSAATLDLERLEDRLAQKLNEQEQSRLALEKELSDLAGRIERQRLDVEVLETRVEQNRKLRAGGLVSEETLRVSEVEARKARIELAQLEGQVAAARRETDARLRGLELELRTLQKERDEARRQLERATTRSDRAGVVTWAVHQEGITVRRGEVVARIADLESFRVEASVSDVHSALLAPGLPVRVRLGDESLDGTLAGIDPTIADGVVKFRVDLAERSHPKLRNNLRVDVLVVTASRADALRLAKGPFFQGGATAPVFVLEGSRAVRRAVRFGVDGYDYSEILDGLSEGEEAILSDMSDYAHLERIEIDR
jgi:HlyD family secretion protein